MAIYIVIIISLHFF